MSTIESVIKDNSWKSRDLEKSTDMKRLFSDGILIRARHRVQKSLNAMSLSDVQSIVYENWVDLDEFCEPNISDKGAGPAIPISHVHMVELKTFYPNQNWTDSKDQEYLSNYKQLREYVGNFWAAHIKNIISATLSGMSDIEEITVGDGTRDLSHKMVEDIGMIKGDRVFNKPTKMYMSRTTISDILHKQDRFGTYLIKGIIHDEDGKLTTVKAGISPIGQFDPPIYICEGFVIVVDDGMKDGIISLVEKDAFIFAQKELSEPLVYDSGNGQNKAWGTRSLFVCHPIGFSFKGALGTNFELLHGLTLAELQAGGMYELKVDPKRSRITNIKVKIG